MKLLFDENLSVRLVSRLAASYPGSAHVDQVGLHGKSDTVIWAHAREHGFAIASKDNDFRQMSFLHGAPPKVIWLSVGNGGTETIVRLLERHQDRIATFDANADESLLVLEWDGP